MPRNVSILRTKLIEQTTELGDFKSDPFVAVFAGQLPPVPGFVLTAEMRTKSGPVPQRG